MQPKEFFLALNKNGIPDEAWNYLQTEIIPDEQLNDLTEGSVYFREVAKALNTFYPDSLSESIKLNLKSILETSEPKPEREPEPEPIIEEETLPEPAPKPGKSKMGKKKEVKAAVKALTTSLRYVKDKKKFFSMKQAIETLKLQVKYMKDGGTMAKDGEIKDNKKTWIVNISMPGEKAGDFKLRKEEIVLGRLLDEFDVQQAIKRKTDDWLGNGRVLSIVEKK